MISLGNRNICDRDGITKDILLSGLQKAIRRGFLSICLRITQSIADFVHKECSSSTNDYDRQAAKATVTEYMHRLMMCWLEDTLCSRKKIETTLFELSMKRAFEARKKRMVDEWQRACSEACSMLCNGGHDGTFAWIRVAVSQGMEIPDIMKPVVRYAIGSLENKPVRVGDVPKGVIGMEAQFWLRHIPTKEKWLVPAAFSVIDAIEAVPVMANESQKEIPRYERFMEAAAVLDWYTIAGRKLGAQVAKERFFLLGTQTNKNGRKLVPDYFRIKYIMYNMEWIDFTSIETLMKTSIVARELLSGQSIVDGWNSMDEVENVIRCCRR